MSDITPFNSNQTISDLGGLVTYKTYNWVNNSQFYSLVPAEYRHYYYHLVRDYFYWYDGFVPYFHTEQSGMFSTKLVKTILKRLSKLIVGNKMLFDDIELDENEKIEYNGKKLNALEFVDEWSKFNTLNGKAKQLSEWFMAGGDGLIKLDNHNGTLKPSIYRKDEYFFDTGFDGCISKAQILMHRYNHMTKGLNGESEEQVFYLLEEREYSKDDKPRFRLAMKKGAATKGNFRSADFNPETIPFDSLPRAVRHRFNKDFGGIALGKWNDLPLRDLGIYIVKNTENVSFLPALPFGESELDNVRDISMLYDFFFSSQATNLYTAKDKVLVPRSMEMPDELKQRFGYKHNEGFDGLVFKMLDFVAPENQKPISIQFPLRAEDWVKIRDTLLQQLAMKFNISVRTVLEAAVPNSEKPTAREIGSDESSTTSFCEEKQDRLKPQLDEMLKTLLEFYNFKNSEIVVKFSKAQLTNINNATTNMSTQIQNKLVDRKTAIETLYPDKNDNQIETMMKLIEEQEEKEFQRSQVQTQYNEQNRSDNEAKEPNVEKKITQNETKDINQTKKPTLREKVKKVFTGK